MIEKIVLRSACLVNEKDWIDIFSAIGPTIAAFIAVWISFSQWKIMKQQKEISLYNARYEKIYKLFFDTLNILNEIFLVEYNEEKLNKSMKEFTEKLNYARFLIKEEDLKKILNLHKQISSHLVKFHGKYNILLKNKLGLSEEEKNNLRNERLKEFPVLNEYIEKKTDEFLKIILPYLQIE